MKAFRLINKAIEAAILAGIEIRNVYLLNDFKIQLKVDNTPVTLADYKAQDAILKVLESTGLPVLSEESIAINYSERKNWDLFWMVDPLDGTKEFIKRNDEFTVNIALIQENQAIAGVIYSPISDELFAGIPGIGAWKLFHPSADCSFNDLQNSGERLPIKEKSHEFIVAVSRSHINTETENFINELRQKHGAIELLPMGSSLKTCRVAEGTANVYPRFGKTMEWDTAAGHAIVKAVGKNIFETDLKTEITYNKENLLNPHFIVI